MARWQTDHVAGLLRAVDATIEVEPVLLDTAADRRLDLPIAAMGGKGVFAKEVQAAVLDGRADIAVHSAKDLPSVTVEGLVLAAIPERGDPRDGLVGSTVEALPEGGRVGTGSARRRVQLAELRPDLVFGELRGNMATRVAKADEFDAVVVAVVALQRLQLDHRLDEVLPVEVMVPQVGQGALAVECRIDDVATTELLAAIEHRPSRRRVDAERAFLAELGGDCELPAGAHVVVVDGGDSDHGALRIDAVLAAPDGATVWRHRAEGADPDSLGRAAARDLISR